MSFFYPPTLPISNSLDQLRELFTQHQVVVDDATRHVPVDHEADAAEHLSLGVAPFAFDDIADAVSRFRIKSH